MNSLILLISSIFLVWGLSGTQTISAQDSKVGPTLVKFEETEHDYGKIEEAKTPRAEYTFKFKNVSDGVVKVIEAKPSCGCTTPSWSQEPIRRTNDGAVLASYDPKNRPGPFDKSITVRVAKFNLAKNEVDTLNIQTIVLKIKGEVIPRPKTALDIYKFEAGNLRFTNNNFAFGTLGRKGTKTKQFTVYNAGKKAITIDKIEAKPYISLKFKEDKKTIAANDSLQGEVSYNLDAVKEYDWQNERIFLYTNDDSLAKKTLYLNAVLLPDFSHLTKEELEKAPVIEMDNSSVDAGTLNKGQKKDISFTITNKGKTSLEILNIKSSCTCLDIPQKINPILPGQNYTFNVQYTAEGKGGETYKTIKLLNNDPKKSMITLGIKSNVVVPAKN